MAGTDATELAGTEAGAEGAGADGAGADEAGAVVGVTRVRPGPVPEDTQLTPPG